MNGGPGRPTMNDVARHAGVGLKTVSRVVNGEPRVSAAMVQKVLASIEELGFRPHEGARVLRRGRTACVGLVLGDVADPFYSVLTRAVERAARAHGHLLFTASSEEDPEQERQLVLALCAGRVDGVIIVPTGVDHSYLEPDVAAGISVVFVDRPAYGIDADAVISDNAGGVYSGVDHLIQQGHRRIGYLGDAEKIFTAAERERGYRTALTDAGLAYDAALVGMGRAEPGLVRAGLERMFDDPDPATAVFTGNNRTTVAVLRELAVRGDRRTALVGFDDFELADLLDPGVTVVAQDAAVLGQTAADLMFQRLGGDRGPARTIEIPTKLVPRGSGEISD